MTKPQSWFLVSWKKRTILTLWVYCLQGYTHIHLMKRACGIDETRVVLIILRAD